MVIGTKMHTMYGASPVLPTRNWGYSRIDEAYRTGRFHTKYGDKPTEQSSMAQRSSWNRFATNGSWPREVLNTTPNVPAPIRSVKMYKSAVAIIKALPAGKTKTFLRTWYGAPFVRVIHRLELPRKHG